MRKLLIAAALACASAYVLARSSIGADISDTGGDSGGPAMDWGWPETLYLLAVFIILALAPEKYGAKLGFWLVFGAPIAVIGFAVLLKPLFR